MQGFDPKSYLRLALATLRAQPRLLVVKAGVDLLMAGMQMLALLVVVLLVTLVVSRSAQLHGYSFLEPALATLLSPRTLFALAALSFGVFMVGFAMQSAVWAVVWDYLGERTQDSEDVPWSGWLRFTRSWGRAAVQRLFLSVVDAFLLATTVVTLISVLWVSRSASRFLESSIVVPAAIWAFALLALSIFGLLVRFAAELVAPAWFIRHHSFTGSLAAAMELACRHPIELYRLFLASAGVLMVPLLGYWAAIMLQNAMFASPDLTGLGTAVRLTGEFVLLVGFAAFAVTLQVMYFAFFAVVSGHAQGFDQLAMANNMSRFNKKNTPPSLQELLPKTYDNVSDLKEVVAWARAGTNEAFRAPAMPPDASVQPYDLAAVLRKEPSEDQEE